MVRTSQINIFTRLIATGIVTASIFAATVANADTYRAGEFTITLSQDANNGRTYRGCDSQGNCINLTNGTAWRDGGSRGITWENGEYGYSVSWREGGSEPMYLNIYKNNTRILRRQLVPIQ
jgi:hypothetical protein